MTAEVGPPSTRQKILDAAIEAFGSRGYDAVSLDALADEIGVSKQTVLYHFGSKENVLDGAITHAAQELTAVIEDRISHTAGWPAIEAVVRAVFRVAVRRPALLGLLREVTRLGEPWSAKAANALDPAMVRARQFLEQEMAKGAIRETDPRLLMVSVYSTVMGVATEIELLRIVGVAPTLRETVNRRNELLRFLRSALEPVGGSS